MDIFLRLFIIIIIGHFLTLDHHVDLDIVSNEKINYISTFFLSSFTLERECEWQMSIPFPLFCLVHWIRY